MRSAPEVPAVEQRACSRLQGAPTTLDTSIGDVDCGESGAVRVRGYKPLLRNCYTCRSTPQARPLFDDAGGTSVVGAPCRRDRCSMMQVALVL